MNEQSRWRLEMARQIARVYIERRGMRAIMVGGSTARGIADRFSDIEIGVFWDEHPEDAERSIILKALNGERWELDPFDPATEDVWYEEFQVAGVKIDLRHLTVCGMDQILDAVTSGADSSEARQEIIFAVQHGIPLFGAEMIRSWQDRAEQYPDALALVMIHENAAFDPWWSVPMLVERGDLPIVYNALHLVTGKVMGVLAGLNRVYFHGLKWLERTASEMPIRPVDFERRVREMFLAPPEVGIEIARQLVEETFDLVEQHRPEIDIAAYREAFRYVRPIMDCAPKGWE